jgi:hypothetical protein
MAQYVLINRRAGVFTEEAKVASRSSLASAIGLIRKATILADHEPADPLARRVVVLEADASEMARLNPTLPRSVIVEPLVRRRLPPRRPGIMRASVPLDVTVARPGKTEYSVKITAAGRPLAGIQVMLYLSDIGGQISNLTVNTDAKGKLTYNPPRGHTIAMVEPIPFDSYWIMLAEAPASGATIDCFPVAKAPIAGNGWWHDAMGIDTSVANRGSGIKVGIIDTGCGPHPNLAHVNLVGAYVDGQILPGSEATDVVQHGTHTTGIVGARPTNDGDYAGMAPGCSLYHARVFKGEGINDGPTQADLINAIDALSRGQGCDLINMSLGGGPPTQAEEDAIRDALQRGTLCICSAGNDDGPIEYPGAYLSARPCRRLANSDGLRRGLSRKATSRGIRPKWDRLTFSWQPFLVLRFPVRRSPAPGRAWESFQPCRIAKEAPGNTWKWMARPWPVRPCAEPSPCSSQRMGTTKLSRETCPARMQR